MAKSIKSFFKKLSFTNISLIQKETPITSCSIETASIMLDFDTDPSITYEFSIESRPIRPIMVQYPPNGKGNDLKPKWYNDYSWLEYSKSKNAVFCFVCRHFADKNSKTETTYTKEGFINLRKACAKFKEHSECKTHKTAEPLYLNKKSYIESCTSKLSSLHKRK